MCMSDDCRTCNGCYNPIVPIPNPLKPFPTEDHSDLDAVLVCAQDGLELAMRYLKEAKGPGMSPAYLAQHFAPDMLPNVWRYQLDHIHQLVTLAFNMVGSMRGSTASHVTPTEGGAL